MRIAFLASRNAASGKARPTISMYFYGYNNILPSGVENQGDFEGYISKTENASYKG
jgi:hypothetical protein